MTISDKIKDILKSEQILFTTPSHDKKSVIADLKPFIDEKFLKYDLSEIDSLDNLAEPENVILRSMKKSAEKIGVSGVFYLINGSTSGILASLMYCLKDDDKVIAARNCHKSVLNGIILTGAEPIWIMPEINQDWQICSPVEPFKIQQMLEQNNDVKAVVITSPTYEGVTSDIAEISKICRKHKAVLIVDEAHGGLKSFNSEYFGKSAVLSGADVAVQSLHKTCGAPNPCAILLCSENINLEKMQNCLNLINTTSPSFPMISAVEATVNYLSSQEGQEQIDLLVKNLQEFKNNLKTCKNVHICNFNDISKILIKIDGLSGFELSEILYEEFKIEDELTNGVSSLLLTGIGTSKQKLKKLERAVKKIAEMNLKNMDKKIKIKTLPIILQNADMSPREAFFAEKISLPLKKSLGKICSEIISEYPPGIPLLIPGETITREHIEYLENRQKLIVCVKD